MVLRPLVMTRQSVQNPSPRVAVVLQDSADLKKVRVLMYFVYIRRYVCGKCSFVRGRLTLFHEAG